jgi:glutamate dehydrogenase
MKRPPTRGPRQRQLEARLLRAWRTSLPASDWRAAGAVALRDAAAAQLRFGARRAPGQTLARVSSPPLPGGHGHSYSVVELITDDMPFLVDTLSLALSEAGHSIQLIAHPIMGAVRGAGGRLLRFGERHGAHAPVNESWQYLRIDRISGAQEAEALQARLRTALADVRHACTDWPAMRQAARAICKQLRDRPPPFSAAVVHESAALLEYMGDNHFTFLGFRRSRVRRTSGGARLVPIAGTELGIVRNMPPPALAPLQATHELLVVTKSNHRSTVHRPGYLDVVAIKEYDAANCAARRSSADCGLRTPITPIRAACRCCAQKWRASSAPSRSVPRATTASGWSASSRTCRATNCSRLPPPTCAVARARCWGCTSAPVACAW